MRPRLPAIPRPICRVRPRPPRVPRAAHSASCRGRTCPQWWTLFHSEPLDRLIRQAIVDSPNLAAARGDVAGARENLAAQTGALLYPQVDANLGATREKISGARLGLPGAGTRIFNLYNASVNVSYALDVFGGNRRELEALQALVDYQGSSSKARISR